MYLVMMPLCSTRQDASNDMDFDLEVILRSRDFWSAVDLDPSRSHTCFDSYRKMNLDGATHLKAQ